MFEPPQDGMREHTEGLRANQITALHTLTIVTHKSLVDVNTRILEPIVLTPPVQAPPPEIKMDWYFTDCHKIKNEVMDLNRSFKVSVSIIYLQ